MEQKLKFISNADVVGAERLIRDSAWDLTIGDPVVIAPGEKYGYTVESLKAAGMVGIYRIMKD